MDHVACGTCGHHWERGTDGSHSCARILAAERDKLQWNFEELEQGYRLLQAERDQARKERDEAFRETGTLRTAVTEAIGLEWGTVCPDDVVIAKACADLKVERDVLRARVEDLEGALRLVPVALRGVKFPPENEAPMLALFLAASAFVPPVPEDG